MMLILRVGLVISLTRLISMSMPFVDTLILGRYDHTQLSVFLIANQIPHLFLVISMGLLVGITILIPRAVDNKNEVVQSILIYSGILSFVSLGLFFIPDTLYDSPNELITKNLMTIGLPFAIGFFAVSSMLESSGHEKKALLISVVAAILNPFLSYLFVSQYIIYFVNYSYAIASLILVTRILMFIVALYILIKLDNGLLFTRVSKLKLHLIELLKLGVPEGITRGVFFSSIAFLALYVGKSSNVTEVALFAIALNIINTLLVFLLGFVISITINISKIRTLSELRRWQALKISIKAILPVIILFTGTIIIFKDHLAYLYLGDNIPMRHELSKIIPCCAAVIVIDCMSAILVSLLKVYGDLTKPPIIKVGAFTVFGVSLSILLREDYSIFGVVMGIALGGVFSFLFLIMRFYLQALKS
jgi:Na+-driven multidrug efflux pump